MWKLLQFWGESLVSKVLSPIKDEFPFILITILLLIVPTYLDTFIFEYDGAPILLKISRNHNGTNIPKVFFIPFLFAYFMAFFSNLFHTRWILWIYQALLLILYAINIFLLFNFDTLLTPMVLMLIVETTGDESSEFFSTYLFSEKSMCAYLTIGVTMLFSWYSEKLKRRCSLWLSNRYMRGLTIIIIAYFFFRGIPYLFQFSKMYQCDSMMEVETFSYEAAVKTNTVTEMLYSIYNMNMCKKEAIKVIDVAVDVQNSSSHYLSQDSLCIVVVIGESYNKYHTPLYGYSLLTTPNMLREYQDSSLIVFDNVITPWNMTSNAMKNIMSTNSIAAHESWADFPFFPTLFKSAGYYVYFWDNQNSGVQADVFDFSLNGIIHNQVFSKLSYSLENTKRYQYDGDLIDDLKNCYRIGKIDLVIIHLMGQHIGAKYRYPKGFGKFKMSDYSSKEASKDMKQAIAEYDNATLYNDSIMGEIFKFFKKQNAVVVYFSDHGEEVYDYRGVIGRTHEEIKTSQNLKYQYDIPFLIWCSPSYIAKNPERICKMRQCKEIPFMTDNVSHLLLGLGCIESRYYHSEHDILNSRFALTKRIVQGHIDYDKIRKSSIYGR